MKISTEFEIMITAELEKAIDGSPLYRFFNNNVAVDFVAFSYLFNNFRFSSARSTISKT